MFLFNPQVIMTELKITQLESQDPSLTDTLLLRELLRSDEDVLIIDRGLSIDPVKEFNLSHKKIVFEKGVTIKANKGDEFGETSDKLIQFVNSDNLDIRAIGANFIMNRYEYTDGEGRHCLAFSGCNIVELYGGQYIGSGGDGIYIGASSTVNQCSNINIYGVRSAYNKRQGISIASAQNVNVYNSIFEETWGTPPEFGVDIEPNNTRNLVKNINFYDSIFRNNQSTGIGLALFHYRLDKEGYPDVSPEIYVRFIRCRSYNNHLAYSNTDDVITVKAECAASNYYEHINKGFVEFKECYIHDSPVSAFGFMKRSESFKVKLDNNFIKNVNNRESENDFMNHPFYMRAWYTLRSETPFGGAEITDNTIIDNNYSGKEFLSLYGTSDTKPVNDLLIAGNRVKGLSEDIKRYDTGNESCVTVFDNKYIDIDSNQDVDVYKNESESSIAFKFERNSKNVNYALSIDYVIDTNLVEGIDYQYDNRCVVFRKDYRTNYKTILLNRNLVLNDFFNIKLV